MHNKTIIGTKEFVEGIPSLSDVEKYEILKKPFIGIKINPGIQVEHKSMIFEQNGEEIPTFLVPITFIAPGSDFSASPITKYDYLYSINGYKIVMKKSEQMFGKMIRVFAIETDDRCYKYLNQIVKHGDTVEVEYAIKTKQKDHVRNYGEEIDIYELRRTQIKIEYLYEINDLKQIMQIEKHKARTFPERIKKQLFNQNHAVDTIFETLKMYWANLKEMHKPIGSYLLTGPTGTGKTEFAKLVAKELGAKFVRIDMSEYSQEHQVARFIGSPAGYIGYNEKTILEKQIGDDKQKTVLLLDEMEKAHSEVHKILLAAMDAGTITLSNHKVVDLSNTLILMTSNLGTVTKESFGFDQADKKFTVDMGAIANHFSPEFLGRLNKVITFNPLKKEHAEIIVNKFIDEFNKEKLRSKKTKLVLSKSATDYLIANGFNMTYGARPLKHFLHTQVYAKLADLFLFSDEFYPAETMIVDYSLEKGIVINNYENNLKEQQLIQEK
jgi:ATP-dependent Clp protease ATP-binding subunit ClpA